MAVINEINEVLHRIEAVRPDGRIGVCGRRGAATKRGVVRKPQTLLCYLRSFYGSN